MLKNHLKRSMTPLCIALVSLVLFQSCQKSVVKEQAEEIEPIRNYLAISTGHKLDQINYVASRKTFVIDKDVLMSLEEAKKRYELKGSGEIPLSANGTSQRVYQYIVSSSIASDIKIYADASVNANWLSILDQAIAQWNNSGSKLRFTRVTDVTTTTTSPTSSSYSAIIGGKGKNKNTTTTTTPTTTTTTTSPTTTTTTSPTTTTTTTTTSSPSFHIMVTTNYETSNTVATAYLPGWDGSPGFQISINTYHNGMSDSHKLFTMIHEIGHTVGFSHTDGSFGTIVPGTPTIDQNSVMNSYVLSWNSFSYYDLQAFRTVYPR